MSSTLLWFLLAVTATLVAAEETETARVGKDETPDNSTILSPAEELLLAAKKAGYELTLERLDEAVAASDEQVNQLMPAPVAEAFISLRRKDNIDEIRAKMIGMTFTGQFHPLGHAPPRLPHQMGGPPLSRRHHMPPRRPNPPPHSNRRNPFSRFHVQFNPQGEASIQSTRKVPSPQEILKPLPFEPGPTMVKFPPHHPAPAPAPPRQNPGPPPSFSKPVEDFSNTVGPDFGPVTFTEFGGPNFGFQNNFENDFGEFTSDKLHPRPPRPSPGQRPSPPGARPPPPSSKRPPTPHRSPPRPAPPRPASRPPSRPPPRTPSRPRPSGFSNGGILDSKGEGCVKYTEDICLDTEKYPHEAILSSLSHDPARARSMVAEVRSQSADELVDGVSAAQESKYDFQHYFGNRRTGTDNHVHRDFAQDGGFLCPSEVKYARPKRARNSKGDWKFVVNMDKYTQTIRMEKCLKPGGACSYVSHHYRATCNQVYNYHRLLSWEDGRGLHMDIFKVPTCCSCHIQGYAYIFPPLSRHQNTAFSNLNPQYLPSPTDLEAPGSKNEGEEGKAYSPVNFPNVPHINQRRLPAPRPPQAHPTPVKEIGRRTHEVETEGEAVNRRSESGRRPQNGAESEEDRVNYGYHPIIDFFDQYSRENRQR